MDNLNQMEGAQSFAQAAPNQPPQEIGTPKHTIYIRNVNYKMESNAIRKALYYEFVKFGKILDIIVGEKRYALKGQAWIVFDTVESAISAQTQMNGKVVLNRPISITFAKNESDLILKREGTFTYQKRSFTSFAAEMAEDESTTRIAPSRVHNNPPNNILLLFDLPSTISNADLLPLFQPYTGFIDIRVVPGGRGLAFVDFDTIRNAGTCLSAVKGTTLPSGIKIYASYAKCHVSSRKHQIME